MKCISISPETKNACGAPATHYVHFADGLGESGEGTVAPTCEPCALHLQETAGAHKTIVKVTRIR